MSAYSIATRGLAGRKVPQGVLATMDELLFAASEPGAWYDPADLSTLFQDSAFTVPVTAVEQPVGGMLDLSGRGNHASQATTTKRSIYSRRVNLLSKTEQLVDAGWVRSSGVTVETGHVDPLGGATGCLVTIPAGGQIYMLSADPGGSAVASVYLKLFPGAAPATVSLNSPNGQGYSINFDSASLQGAWSRLISPPSNTAVRNGFRFLNGPAEAKFYAWGASLTLATDAHLPYQRVNTASAYDADPSKFPAYLRFDGVDDALQTGNIDFTSTDKMTVWAGLTKLSDVSRGVLVELANGSSSGSFSVQAPASAGSGDYLFLSRGSIQSFVAKSGYPSPRSSVLCGKSSISEPSVSLRIDGATVASSIADQGSGSYGNYPLYIGARIGTSNYFNGRLYSLIVRGAQSSLSQIEAAERYIKQKMRLP